MKRVFCSFLCFTFALTMLLGGVPAAAEEKGPLWLTDEKAELTIWYDLDPSYLGNAADLNEMEVYKWLEEQTNVHINWIIPVKGTAAESFHLLFASDKMPDIIRTTDDRQYVDGAEAAVEDGYFLRLNELLEKYAPNYLAYLDANEELKKEVKTDSGLMWGMYWFYINDGRPANAGPSIRKDFLDAVGMDMPVTYDDWHEVLTAFKEQLHIEGPLWINGFASSTYDDWMSGYGVTQSFYQVDGKVKYGPIEDGYGEYIAMMAKWYAEGLIYPDFPLGGADRVAENLILNDIVGAWEGYASNAGDQYWPKRGAVNPDFNVVGAMHPLKAAGEKNHLRMSDLKTSDSAYVITTDCENPELAIRWLDIFYNMEYNDIFNYGFHEGETYVVNEDGSLSWGPIILKNPDGLTVTQARNKYTMHSPMLGDYTRVMGSWTKEQLEACDTWMKADAVWRLPSKLSPNADESREINSVMTDIETFVKEETVKMILGNSTYTFETFREKIVSMGIDTAISAYQTVLDRYNAR